MEINEIIRKYRNNQLTPTELKELREKVNSMSDSELLEAMLEDLPQEAPGEDKNTEPSIQKISQILNRKINSDFNISPESRFNNREINNTNITNRQETLCTSPVNKEEINTRTNSNPSRLKSFSHIGLRWAAILIIPLICIVIWLCNPKNAENFENALTISTIEGEKANITLPDGSRVSLNYKSSLKYSPKSFNKEHRQVSFEGEGYFDIVKDPNNPFIIKTPDIQVKVLGTTFNILARQIDNQGEVILIKGKVELSSLHSDQVVIMNSNTRASIDLATGKIALDSLIRPEIPWQKGYISFSDKPLKSVIQALTSNYNRQISINDSNIINEHFSGYVPSNDLDMALQIIGDIFNLNVEKQDGSYNLSKK